MDDMIFTNNGSPEKVVIIEYQRNSRRRCWLPFSVITLCAEYSSPSFYDFEYCDNTDLGWFKSGGGGEVRATVYSGYKKEIDTKIWVAPGIPIKLMLWRGKRDNFTYHDISPVQMRRRGHELLAKPLKLFKKSTNPFDVSEGTENGFIWCKICNKNFIRDDMAVCEHLRWCDECLAYVYPDHSSEDSSTPTIHKESA